MQRPHPLRHLFWRATVGAFAQATMYTGLYPFVPLAVRLARKELPGATVRGVLREWGAAVSVSAARPWGFWPLPGALNRGPRPVIVLHGYAMNRANFLALAQRMAQAGLGPVYGFEYWTLGRTAAAARQLGWFVDEVRAATGAATVDLVGHSMGGVVAKYYVSLAGGDGPVANLVTIGSPLGGTDVSRFGIGHPGRELLVGSKLVTRLATAAAPTRTRVTAIWSTSDALVPGHLQQPPAGTDVIMYTDLGHVSLLGSQRVAREVIARLSRPEAP